MKWLFGTMLGALIVMSFGNRARSADDKDAQAILDKAIKALGGQDKLSRIKAATWKTQGKITSYGVDSEYISTSTVQGLDRFRVNFESDFKGTKVKVVTVLDKAKGWSKVGEQKKEMDENALSGLRRAVYLEVVPMTLVRLKDKSFKVAAAGEKRIGDKPAIGLQVTGPDGKDFTLFLNKDSCLPIMMTAKMSGLRGKKFTEETSFADYKELAGIKKATKIVAKRDGDKYLESRITEFKVLDEVDPKTFDEPK
jgi:hypothetical protein